MFGKVFKTVSGVAKSALGTVSAARKVMDFNPSLSGLLLPPQISMGLKVANVVGGMVGVKIPTESDIKDFAQGKLDNVLGGIRSKVKTPLGQIEAALQQVSSINNPLSFAQRVMSRTVELKGLSPEEILNSIEWLL